jgi:hypothetical protein
MPALAGEQSELAMVACITLTRFIALSLLFVFNEFGNLDGKNRQQHIGMPVAFYFIVV